MLSTNGDHEAPGNQLLSSLSPAEWLRLRPRTQSVYLSAGQVLHEAGAYLDQIYFPTTAVISCLTTMQDGAIAESTLVGNDGLIGIFLLLGSNSGPQSAIVQIGGNALKIPARLVQDEFAKGGQLQRVFLRYTQGLLTTISQVAACNCLHTVEQRLSRWLLLCHDRVAGAEILMTHEYIAHALGGRRETVTLAAGHLQEAGLIHYARGHITIADRSGLEKMACECYRTVEDELTRLLDTRDLATHLG